MADLTFSFLAGRNDAIPLVSRWLHETWGHWGAQRSREDVEAALRRQLGRDRVPFQLVAIVGGRVVGVAGVKEHELGDLYPDKANWLGNVFVDPAHRHEGIASALVETVATHARSLGVPVLHLQTEALDGGLYSKLGWYPITIVEEQKIRRLVMVRALASDEPVRIVPYDASWPDLFEEERRDLTNELSPWLVGPIEHIGSTSVPGLAAKPVIDMMAPVKDLDSSRPAIGALFGHGYFYSPYREDVMHWFCKPSLACRTHHLHLVPFRSTLWTDRLTFRDVLRRDPRLASDYERLKRRLAELHEFDREAYTDAKGSFVRETIDDHRR